MTHARSLVRTDPAVFAAWITVIETKSLPKGNRITPLR
jgi:hypothetical protein